MTLAVYGRLPKNTETKTWLKNALRAAIADYDTVWMSKPRLTETGLSRYYGSGSGRHRKSRRATLMRSTNLTQIKTSWT